MLSRTNQLYTKPIFRSNIIFFRSTEIPFFQVTRFFSQTSPLYATRRPTVAISRAAAVPKKTASPKKEEKTKEKSESPPIQASQEKSVGSGQDYQNYKSETNQKKDNSKKQSYTKFFDAEDGPRAFQEFAKNEKIKEPPTGKSLNPNIKKFKDLNEQIMNSDSFPTNSRDREAPREQNANFNDSKSKFSNKNATSFDKSKTNSFNSKTQKNSEEDDFGNGKSSSFDNGYKGKEPGLDSFSKGKFGSKYNQQDYSVERKYPSGENDRFQNDSFKKQTNFEGRNERNDAKAKYGDSFPREDRSNDRGRGNWDRERDKRTTYNEKPSKFNDFEERSAPSNRFDRKPNERESNSPYQDGAFRSNDRRDRGGDRNDRGSGGGYRGGERNNRGSEGSYRGGEGSYRGGDRSNRGSEGSYRGGDRNYRGGERSNREGNYRGGDRNNRGSEGSYRGGEGSYRGGDRSNRGGEGSYRGGDRSYRGGEGSYRGGERSNRGGEGDRGYRGNDSRDQRERGSDFKSRSDQREGGRELNDFAEKRTNFKDAKNDWKDSRSSNFDRNSRRDNQSRFNGRDRDSNDRRSPNRFEINDEKDWDDEISYEKLLKNKKKAAVVGEENESNAGQPSSKPKNTAEKWNRDFPPKNQKFERGENFSVEKTREKKPGNFEKKPENLLIKQIEETLESGSPQKHSVNKTDKSEKFDKKSDKIGKKSEKKEEKKEEKIEEKVEISYDDKLCQWAEETQIPDTDINVLKQIFTFSSFDKTKNNSKLILSGRKIARKMIRNRVSEKIGGGTDQPLLNAVSFALTTCEKLTKIAKLFSFKNLIRFVPQSPTDSVKKYYPDLIFSIIGGLSLPESKVGKDKIQDFVNKHLVDEGIEGKKSCEEILIGEHSVRTLVDIFYSRGDSPNLKLLLSEPDNFKIAIYNGDDLLATGTATTLNEAKLKAAQTVLTNPTLFADEDK